MREPELERYVFENASGTAVALYDSSDPERALARPFTDYPRRLRAFGPPDGRPGPSLLDAAGAQRLAASLVRPEHADGVAMVLAFAEAAAVLEPVVRSAGRGRDALAPLEPDRTGAATEACWLIARR